jgi:hypothetical protein
MRTELLKFREAASTSFFKDDDPRLIAAHFFPNKSCIYYALIMNRTATHWHNRHMTKVHFGNTLT